jgi:hypothetical protein
MFLILYFALLMIGLELLVFVILLRVLMDTFLFLFIDLLGVLMWFLLLK